MTIGLGLGGFVRVSASNGNSHSTGSRDGSSREGRDGNGANGAGGKKKKRRVLLRRKRSLDPNLVIDYKNPDVLKRFITDRGKIIPRRISGATQAQQREITLAVKRARFLSLIPSAVTHRVERGFAGEMQTVAQSFSTSALRSRPVGGPGGFGGGPGGDRPAFGGDRGPGMNRGGERPKTRRDEGEDTDE
jgi:small subunit ribosomal protein S18